MDDGDNSSDEAVEIPEAEQFVKALNGITPPGKGQSIAGNVRQGTKIWSKGTKGKRASKGKGKGKEKGKSKKGKGKGKKPWQSYAHPQTGKGGSANSKGGKTGAKYGKSGKGKEGE